MGNFLTSWKPVRFSRRTLFHGISKLGNHIYEPCELPSQVVLYILWIMYFGDLSVAYKFLQMAYNINTTGTDQTTLVTENGLKSKQHTFSNSPTC